MPFFRSVDPRHLPRFCGGRLLPALTKEGWGALLCLLIAFPITAAQNSRPTPKKASVPTHANELTLAALRPGRDLVASAISKYKKPLPGKPDDTSLSWTDICRHSLLSVDFDSQRKIQVIRTEAAPWMNADCSAMPPSPWRTGRGLRVGDPTPKLVQLYGKPDSLSPSTRDGQPLELWYYAFDWAGADVPQVMEVLCTKEKDGVPGKVIEITLAAASL